MNGDVTVAGTIKAETDKALLLRIESRNEDMHQREVWIPHDACTKIKRYPPQLGVTRAEVTVEPWLARKERLTP
jgi:uncharacterized protein YpmB